MTRIHFWCATCKRYHSAAVSLKQRTVVCPGCGETRDADYYLGPDGLAASETGVDLPTDGAYPTPQPN